MTRLIAFALLVGLLALSAGQRTAVGRRGVAFVVPSLPPQIVAHEWGVFRVHSQTTDYIEELAAECPSFVRRMPRASSFPFRDPSTFNADKPVLFLYGDASDVEIEVTFASGEPWLVFPPALGTPDGAAAAPGGSDRRLSSDESEREMRVQTNRTLTWRGELRSARSPVQRASGFWNDLRSVGAATFIARASENPGVMEAARSERFIFYDGPMVLSRTARFDGASVVDVVSGGAAADAPALPIPAITSGYVMTRQGITRVERQPTGWSTTLTLNVQQARAMLLADLTREGLSRSEAESLLRVWRDDLFRSRVAQFVYLMPRAMYDGLLPIRISPAPRELVRVGVVIDRG